MASPVFKTQQQLLEQSPVRKDDHPAPRSPLAHALKASTHAAGEAALSPANQPGYDEQVAARRPKRDYSEQDQLRTLYFRATGVLVAERDDAKSGGERSYEVDGAWISAAAFSRHVRDKLKGDGVDWDDATVQQLAELYVAHLPQLIDCHGWEDHCRPHGERPNEADGMEGAAAGMAISGPAIREAARWSGYGATLLTGGVAVSHAMKGAAAFDVAHTTANFGMRMANHVGAEVMDKKSPHPDPAAARKRVEEKRRVEGRKPQNIGRFVESYRPGASEALRKAIIDRVHSLLPAR